MTLTPVTAHFYQSEGADQKHGKYFWKLNLTTFIVQSLKQNAVKDDCHGHNSVLHFGDMHTISKKKKLFSCSDLFIFIFNLYKYVVT